MESAIFIRELSKYNGRYLENYIYRFGESNYNGIKEAFEQINPFLPNEFHYLYFGSEFCEHVIPEPEEILQWKKICQTEKLKPIFVTPVISDRGLQKLGAVLDLIWNELPETEIIVNDYGVAELIRKKYPTLKMSIGRVLDKLTHDSRAIENEFMDYYGINGLRYAVTAGNISEHSRKALSKYNVNRFEYDLPYVGINLPEKSFNYSLYWPFSFLTTGRVCVFRALEKEGVHRFLVENDSCSQMCRKVDLVLRKPLNGFRTKDNYFKNELYLFQKGNTIFYLSDTNVAINSLPQFDRVVIELL